MGLILILPDFEARENFHEVPILINTSKGLDFDRRYEFLKQKHVAIWMDSYVMCSSSEEKITKLLIEQALTGVRRKAAKMFGNDFCHLTNFFSNFFISISGLIHKELYYEFMTSCMQSTPKSVSNRRIFFSNFYILYSLLSNPKLKWKKNSSNGRSHSQTFWRPFYEPLPMSASYYLCTYFNFYQFK